jgi:hypothetical protein
LKQFQTLLESQNSLTHEEGMVCLKLPIAAVTNHHKKWLKTTPWRTEVQKQRCWQNCIPSEGFQRESSPHSCLHSLAHVLIFLSKLAASSDLWPLFPLPHLC